MHTKLHPPDPTFLPNIPLQQQQGILADALSIRIQVFVDEQGCSAENEVDEDDARSWHWVMYEDVSTSKDNGNGKDNGKDNVKNKAIGTVRLVPPSPSQSQGTNSHSASNTHSPDCSSSAYVQITRVAVLPTHRGHGIGRHLVETAVEWAGKHAATINGADAGAGTRTGATTSTSSTTATAINGDREQRTVQEVDQDQDQDPDRGAGAGAGARARMRTTWTGLVLVHAQVDVEGMYARLGFERDEGMGRWMEEGIEHVGMWKRTSTSTSKCTP